MIEVQLYQNYYPHFSSSVHLPSSVSHWRNPPTKNPSTKNSEPAALPTSQTSFLMTESENQKLQNHNKSINLCMKMKGKVIVAFIKTNMRIKTGTNSRITINKK